MTTGRSQLTTEGGAPVGDNQHAQTAGPGGPVLLQDHHLIEKLARFIAASLSRVSRPEIVERSIEHFRKADPEYGARVAEAVAGAEAVTR